MSRQWRIGRFGLQLANLSEKQTIAPKCFGMRLWRGGVNLVYKAQLIAVRLVCSSCSSLLGRARGCVVHGSVLLCIFGFILVNTAEE